MSEQLRLTQSSTPSVKCGCCTATYFFNAINAIRSSKPTQETAIKTPFVVEEMSYAIKEAMENTIGSIVYQQGKVNHPDSLWSNPAYRGSGHLQSRKNP